MRLFIESVGQSHRYLKISFRYQQISRVLYDAFDCRCRELFPKRQAEICRKRPIEKVLWFQAECAEEKKRTYAECQRCCTIGDNVRVSIDIAVLAGVVERLNDSANILKG